MSERSFLILALSPLFTDSLPWAVKAPANDWNDSLGSGMLGTKPHIQDFAEFLDDQAGDIRKESVGVPTGRRWDGLRREPGCHAHIGAVLVSVEHQERGDCRSPDDGTSIRCDNPAIPKPLISLLLRIQSPADW